MSSGYEDEDPIRWAIACQCDETHINWRLPAMAKLYGYHMLREVFLRQNDCTVSSWCLVRDDIRSLSPAEFWGQHDMIAKDTCGWLQRYGWSSCPGW